MTEATPRPWRVGDTDPALIWACGDDEDYFICEIQGGASDAEREANAALIVRAVNNYDEALALLREAREELQTALSANAEHVSDAIDDFLKENSNG